MNARAQGGFTLLEIIAALALLAFLMVGVWAGIHTTTQSVERGRVAVARLDTRRGAEQFLRRNFTQVQPMPWARTANGRAVVFVGKPHAMRFVAPLPGFLGRMGPQLQTLELVPDGDGTLRLQIAFSLLPPDGSAPRPFGKPQVLLTGIRKGKFIYRGGSLMHPDSGWQGTWPYPARLPSLVKVVLTPTRGSWPTLEVPLRVNASAVNRGNVRAAGLQALQP